MSATPDINLVIAYLRNLHDRISDQLEALDGQRFRRDAWQRPEGGGGESRVLSDGSIFEQAGINFSHVVGNQLPPSATAARPELSGASWAATGISLVFHPRNPYIPTTHANVRFFLAEKPGMEPVWWFGGGFDLTPFYPFDADIVHWHQVAQQACLPFGSEVYSKYKAECDRYFFSNIAMKLAVLAACFLTI